ncbi:hypothetical protein V8C43DRAFT_297926 [Trichoderma afarasin]
MKMAYAIRNWLGELILFLLQSIVPQANQSPRRSILHRCIELSFTSYPIVLECGVESPMPTLLRIIAFILFLAPLQLEATLPADQHHFGSSP